MTYRQLGKSCLLALSLAVLLWSVAAKAETVVQLAGTGNGPSSAGGGEAVCGSCGEAGAYQWVAGQFTLSQSAIVTEVKGWFSTPSATSGSVNAVIYVDKNGLPGTPIWSQSYSVSEPAGANGFYTFTGYSAVLPAGTYWVSFQPPHGSAVDVGMPGGGNQPTPASQLCILQQH